MFSIEESFKYAWGKFKENLKTSVLATLFIVVLSLVNWKEDHFSFLLFLAVLILIIISIIVKMGYSKLFLRMYDGEKPEFFDIFREYRIFWRYLGVSIFLTLTVASGLLLLIIPGIFWAVRFSFAPLIVIDTKIEPIRAMRESWTITKGSFWKLLGFYVLIALINLVGVMFFLVGLLVSLPISTFSSINVYRKLSDEKAGLIKTSPENIPQNA
ncbi:MAG: hypothetical protein JW740_02335 [Candidatus Zambryskibacteria bacterium]|nr:hypothetical protein [Candidatus Zambryskibacteria bacterium]